MYLVRSQFASWVIRVKTKPKTSLGKYAGMAHKDNRISSVFLFCLTP